MAQTDDFLSIQTPENIVFGYEVAGLGTRFIAAVFDSLIIAALLVVLSLAGLFFGTILDVLDSAGVGWIVGTSSVLSFLIFWGYYVVFEMLWTGQTPGKRRMGLRVIGRNGTPVGLAASLIRNLIRLADFIPALYGLGSLTMFISPETRRLGDYAAGTLVVFDKNVTLETLSVAADPLATKAPIIETTFPVERLDEAEIAIAEAWLERRSGLSTERQLLRPILQRLYNSMELELAEQLPYDIALNRIQTIVREYRRD